MQAFFLPAPKTKGMGILCWRTIVEGLLTLLYPPRCAVCLSLQEPVLCAACRNAFRPITAPYCRICGVPFEVSAADGDGLCADCRTKPPPFTEARAAGRYDGTLRHAIHRFKYDGVRALAWPLAAFMLETVPQPEGADGICPVPLHPARERMRGFNQAHLLAKALAARWELPLLPVLTRTRHTAAQMQLPADERLGNVRGAFTAQAALADRRVILVDDVFTTGSTLAACTRALKAAGAASVRVVTLARTTSTID